MNRTLLKGGVNSLSSPPPHGLKVTTSLKSGQDWPFLNRLDGATQKVSAGRLFAGNYSRRCDGEACSSER